MLQVRRDKLVQLGRLELMVSRVSLGRRAARVQLEELDRLEHLEQLVFQALLGTPVHLVLMALLVPVVPRDNRVLKVSKDSPAHQDQLDHKDLLEHRDNKGLLDLLDPLVQLALRVPVEALGLQGLKVVLDRPGLPDLWVSLERRASREVLE